MAARTIVLQLGGREYHAVVHDDGRVVVDGREFRALAFGSGQLRIEADASTPVWVARDGDTRWVFANGRAYELSTSRGQSFAKRRGSHHGSLMAPMPATVRRIEVEVGQHVRKGDTLLVLEAMKMELPVKATGDGTVDRIACRIGELVQPGVPLIELDEAS